MTNLRENSLKGAGEGGQIHKLILDGHFSWFCPFQHGIENSLLDEYCERFSPNLPTPGHPPAGESEQGAAHGGRAVLLIRDRVAQGALAVHHRRVRALLLHLSVITGLTLLLRHTFTLFLTALPLPTTTLTIANIVLILLAILLIVPRTKTFGHI